MSVNGHPLFHGQMDYDMILMVTADAVCTMAMCEK